jgi:hypothetical protein
MEGGLRRGASDATPVYDVLAGARPSNFDHVIRPAVDHLTVHAKNRSNGRVHLRGGIMRRLQPAHRKRNQFFEGGNVLFARDSYRPGSLHKIDIYSNGDEKPSAL